MLPGSRAQFLSEASLLHGVFEERTMALIVGLVASRTPQGVCRGSHAPLSFEAAPTVTTDRQKRDPTGQLRQTCLCRAQMPVARQVP